MVEPRHVAGKKKKFMTQNGRQLASPDDIFACPARSHLICFLYHKIIVKICNTNKARNYYVRRMATIIGNWYQFWSANVSITSITKKQVTLLPEIQML